MTAARLVVVAAACLAGAVVPAVARADATLEVAQSPARVSTRLGDEFRFTTTVSNRGAAVLSGLVAHLNIASWDRDVYVDPEDWSSQRTRYLAPLAPGQSREIRWTVKAVNPGHFAIYAAVLDHRRPAAGPELDVRVTERRTINSGGVLPLALAVPGLLGLAMVGVRLRRPR
jgi:hypothetical protein